MGHLDPVGRHIEQTLCSLQHIRQMPQHILHLLLRLIGYIRKKAERRNIHEDIIIKFSHIAGKQRAIHRVIRCPKKSFRDMQAIGKIVGRSCRDIANGIPLVSLHHPGYHFVDSPVPAAADYQVIFIRIVL